MVSACNIRGRHLTQRRAAEFTLDTRFHPAAGAVHSRSVPDETIVGRRRRRAVRLTELKELTGVTHFHGATTLTGLDGSRQRTKNDEFDGARYQVRHVAEIANKLFG